MDQKFYYGCHKQGMHRIAYTEWNKNNHERTVLCVHGLTRNSRDFDFLAQRLEENFRVICVDMPGRGKSDWLPVPEYYGFEGYFHDLAALIARLNVEKVDWIGTSMGGSLGFTFAGMDNSFVNKLILNDASAIYERPQYGGGVRPFSGKIRAFDTMDDVEQYVRKIFAPMGVMSSENWRHLAEHSVNMHDDGKYRLSYDPSFFLNKSFFVSDEERMKVWAKITCPIYMLHGVESDIVSPRIIGILKQSQPKMTVVDIPNVGHTPSLMEPEQIELIKGWLLE